MGDMDRAQFVLSIQLPTLTLEPVLVLVAVGHGGTFKAIEGKAACS